MFSLNELGFIRAGVAVPELKLANPAFNCRQIADLCGEASSQQVQVLVFPELCITGYSVGDLFHQRLLLEAGEKELAELLQDTRTMDMVIVVGLPVRADNQLFNCAVVLHQGKILGVVPKTFIPNYNEFYEHRWFSSALQRISDEICLCGQLVPFNENLLFNDTSSELVIGVEICEDLWMPCPPSSNHAQHGANLLLNLSASNEIVGKADYRRMLVEAQSAKCMAAYLYASAGPSESTTDLVFSGHAIIAENGIVFQETRMNYKQTLLIEDIDIERLMNDRRKFNTFMGKATSQKYQTKSFQLNCPVKSHNDNGKNDLHRRVDPRPFVPANKQNRDARCADIFNIQAAGLAQRLDKAGIKKAVVGISGGLDSTLALLVTYQAYKKLRRPVKDILGITMPGFGTSNRTHDNAVTLMQEMGITTLEIPIGEACLKHMQDIGHDPDVHDVTYENVQARERTQILMDLANQEGGLVVGTGDLSELALGWSTYNGDHMSMYAVNSGVPKTLVLYLVEWVAQSAEPNIKEVLEDILATPISPELLPPDKDGNIQQMTEEVIGSYDLHDFFLYYVLRFGFSPTKIICLAENAFENIDRKTLVYWLKVFYKRFFTQQYKRSCMPDGVKVGSVSLSPRGDWRMPSDASYEIWVNELASL
ncbi:MAG: NH(3)-dependent synthetase [Firmicutes bacterium]|nr:NH(3)-dependent synthetase [Bacillota bacterium]